jgi:hypothetical protein
MLSIEEGTILAILIDTKPCERVAAREYTVVVAVTPVDTAAASIDGLFSQSWLMLICDRAAAAESVKRTIIAIQVIAILFDAKPRFCRKGYSRDTVSYTSFVVAAAAAADSSGRDPG